MKDVLIDRDPRFPPATLMEPTAAGFFLIAAEIDHRPPFLYRLRSRAKIAALDAMRRAARALATREDVTSARLFRALLIPPGRGALLKRRPDVPVARFDVVLLVECADLGAAERLAATPEMADLKSDLDRHARRTLSLTATNPARMGPVPERGDGVYLFNWFYADDGETNLAVWKETAGWFEAVTGLRNSVPMRPRPGSDGAYTLINHCRWDSLRDILPHLALRPSFRRYVLGTFERNGVAAMPILYRAEVLPPA